MGQRLDVGRVNASFFPVPLWDVAIWLRPANAGSIAIDWTGVGTVNPCATRNAADGGGYGLMSLNATMISGMVNWYFTKPRRTSSIAVMVSFLEEVGSKERLPRCSCRARLAATMTNR